MLERMSRPLRGLLNGIAGAVDGFYGVLGRPGKWLQDFLNGSWLGHSLHAVIVDVVIGGATAALLLDVLRVAFAVDGLEAATTWVVALAGLAALGAIVSGLTDYKDTAPSSSERDVTGLHGVVNIAATAFLAVSLLQRLGGGYDAAFWVLLAGYLVVSIGGYIGGHVVYKYGYMVNHNAFSRPKRAKEFTPVASVLELADDVPTKVMLGATGLLVVRRGDVVRAIMERCSHAGGPLSDGELDGDRITCPWHYSTFSLTDGRVLHGPAGTAQPAYVARINGDQVEVRGPVG